jgi:DNA-directed RNA polymerase subunit RPC12/RpoP
MANSGPRGLVTMVCITCGAEQFFDQSVPSSITCTKCGSSVFRQFATPTQPDEATIAQLEEQARSMSYGDPSPDSTADDVRDLGNR